MALRRSRKGAAVFASWLTESGADSLGLERALSLVRPFVETQVCGLGRLLLGSKKAGRNLGLDRSLSLIRGFDKAQFWASEAGGVLFILLAV